jgi:hypothetical protein
MEELRKQQHQQWMQQHQPQQQHDEDGIDMSELLREQMQESGQHRRRATMNRSNQQAVGAVGREEQYVARKASLHPNGGGLNSAALAAGYDGSRPAPSVIGEEEGEEDPDPVWTGLRRALRDRGLSHVASAIVNYVGELMAEMGLVGEDENALLFLRQMHPSSRQGLVDHLRFTSAPTPWDQQEGVVRVGAVSAGDERMIMTLWAPEAPEAQSALSAIPSSPEAAAVAAEVAGAALAEAEGDSAGDAVSQAVVTAAVAAGGTGAGAAGAGSGAGGGTAAVPTSGALKVGYSAMNTDGLEEFLDDLCLDQHTTSVEALLRAASAIPDGGSPTGRKDISGVSIFDLPRFCRLTGLGITPDMRGGMYDIMQPAPLVRSDGSAMSTEAAGQLREMANAFKESMSDPELERFELGVEQLLLNNAVRLQCWLRSASAVRTAREKAGAGGSAALGLAMGGLVQAKDDVADARAGKKKAGARAGRRRSVMKRPKKTKGGDKDRAGDAYLSALAAMEQLPPVMEGYMDKFSTGLRKRWQKRYFMLRGTCLFYYSDEYSLQSTKGQLNLQDGNIVRVAADGKHKLALALFDEDGGQALLLRTPTEAAHENWLEALHQPSWEGGEDADAGQTEPEATVEEEALAEAAEEAPTKPTPRKSKRAVA